MIVQQPQFSPVVQLQSDRWSTGICECFDDCSVCCFALWCPLSFTCTTASDFGECFCLPLIDLPCMWLCGVCPSVPPMSMALRASVRNRYGIQGDLTGDCLYVTFCNLCSWCQIAREIKKRRTNFVVVNAQPTLIGAPPMVVPSPRPIVTTQVTTVGL